MHVHVHSSDGEAKFWLEPEIALADFCGLSDRELKKIRQIIEERRNEIKKSWEEHFSR